MRAALAIAAVAVAASGCPKKPAATGGGGGGPPDTTDAGAGDDTVARQVAAITAAVNDHGIAVHTCWAMGAADDFELSGRVLLRLTLGEGGAVADVAVEGDEPGDEVLTSCLVELWKASRWPAQLFAAGDEIRLPPLDFVAPSAQYVVNARHAVLYPIGEAGAGGERSAASVLLDRKNTGNGAGGLTLLRLQPGHSAPLHKHTSAELVYVLAGTAELSGHRKSGKPQSVSRGDAVFVPAQAPHAFVVSGSEPLVLLQLYAPGGPEQRFKGVDVGGTVAVDPRGRRGRRDPEVVVRAHAKAPVFSIAGGKGTASLVFDAETAPDNAASLGGLTLEAGVAVPEHRHGGATEILFVLEGGGTMTVAGEAREVTRLDAIQIPPNVAHGFVAGADGVKAIQFYTPSGPEQRFKNK